MSTDQKTVDWYNQNANDYTTLIRSLDNGFYHHLYEKPAMYSLLPNIKRKKVISLGCGSGEDCQYLKEQGAKESVGIDIARELIKIAKKSYPECVFKVMDMENLDFPKESFDFIYSSLAIHYLETWDKTFEQAYKVLKPKSYFLFSCIHPVWTSMVKTEDNNEKKVKQFARIRNKKTNKVEVIGNYIDRYKVFNSGRYLTVTLWHKSFSEIYSEIKHSGFIVKDIIEPKPLKEMKEIKPDDYEVLSKIPYFIIFKLYKN